MLINGTRFVEMLVSSANALENLKDKINDLNVFPVPDGDTGTNMSASLAPIRTLAYDNNNNIGEISAKIADLVLKASRGNSGAILAMFFCGFAKSIEGIESAETVDFAKAFRGGVEKAYRAVSHPVEGTMLTVMNGCAEIAEQICLEYKGKIYEFFSKIGERAEVELSRTPELLAVLKQARVVDSGGYGFVIIIKAIVLALANNPIALDKNFKVSESANFSEFDSENILFTYCTECVVEKFEKFQNINCADALNEFLLTIGDSLVFMENDEIIKFHVHTNNPGKVLEKALEYGDIATVDINNMRKQHDGLVLTEVATTLGEVQKEYGFVSVCSGDGIKSVFYDLCVDQIVDGGITMNCNTESIFNGIKDTNAKVVFVLPNNKNVQMVAERAKEMTKDKQVIIIPTVTVAEGINVITSFDGDLSIEENCKMMNEAIENTQTLLYSVSVKDCCVSGITAKQGQYVGILRTELISSADTLKECVMRSSDIINDAEFITVYYSGSLTEEEVNNIFNDILTNDDVEVLIKRGGQPLYDLIISIE